MGPSESIREVIDRGVALTPCEAVAVAQQLIASANIEVHRPPSPGPLSLDEVRLGADGSVACDQGTAPLRARAIGMLLAEMLPHEGAVRVPGALRYTIARALSEVEAPPFDSVADLSVALSRHAQCARVAVVRELYARAAAKPPQRAATAVDRRRRTPSAATLRRQLREADEELFSHLHRTLAAPTPPQPAPPGAAAADPFIPYAESADLAVGDDRFNTAGWAVGAAVALLMAFGAGYMVVAGVLATQLTIAATQSAASPCAPMPDSSQRPLLPR